MVDAESDDGARPAHGIPDDVAEVSPVEATGHDAAPDDGTAAGTSRIADAPSPSAPWERPARWAIARPELRRAEDLIAELTGTQPAAGSRRRRRTDPDGDTAAVAASSLIAALSTADTTVAGAVAGGVADGVSTEIDDGLGGAIDDAAGDGAGDAVDNGAGGALSDEVGDPTNGGADGPAGVDESADSPDTTVLGDASFGAAASGAATVDDATTGAEAPGPGAHESAAASTDVGAATDMATGAGSVSAAAGRADTGSAAAGTDDGAAAGGAAAASTAIAGPPPYGDVDAPVHADRSGRGWWIAGRSVIAIVAAVALIVVGTYWVIWHRADSTLADNQISAVAPSDPNIVDPITRADSDPDAPAVGGTASDQPENILLMGSDTRATAEDAQLGGAGTTTMQSDVLMLMHLSADRSHISVVSIPRDLYVTAPTCKAWDYRTNTLSDTDYVSQYSEWKITNAYSVGGPACTVKAIQQLTGLQINRVIIIDFAGFRTMVDALGGIDVNVCRPIIDGNLGTVLPTAGEQHIDGAQALKLVRAREVQGDSEADLARIRRQQKVLSTMLRQATSTGVLLDPGQLDSVLQSFVHSVKADNVTLKDLLDLADSLGNLDPHRVTFYTLPTVPADGSGGGLNAAPVDPLVWQALRNDQPLPGEDAAPPTPSTTTSATTPSSTSSPAPEVSTRTITKLVTSTPAPPKQTLTVAPSQVDLQVVNVTGRPGVATDAMNKLTPSGFQLAQADLLLVPGDVRQSVTVEYSAGNRAAALTVAAAVPGAELDETDGLGSKVRLMLGSSFDGTIRSVAAGQELPAALSTAAKPTVLTKVSTAVSTVAPTTPTTAPTTTPTTTSTSPVLDTSDIQLHNAANASCI